jgi:hypothetical protein
MKKLAIASLGIMCSLLVGCSNLQDKTVLIEADGTGIKGSTVADAASGTPAPSFWLGLFNALWLSHPKDAPAFCFYKESSATFNADAKTKTFIWIDRGTKANLSVEPDKIIDIPGLKVVSGSNTINISADTTIDSSKSSN